VLRNPISNRLKKSLWISRISLLLLWLNLNQTFLRTCLTLILTPFLLISRLLSPLKSRRQLQPKFRDNNKKPRSLKQLSTNFVKLTDVLQLKVLLFTSCLFNSVLLITCINTLLSHSKHSSLRLSTRLKCLMMKNKEYWLYVKWFVWLFTNGSLAVSLYVTNRFSWHSSQWDLCNLVSLKVLLMTTKWWTSCSSVPEDLMFQSHLCLRNGCLIPTGLLFKSLLK